MSLVEFSGRQGEKNIKKYSVYVSEFPAQMPVTRSFDVFFDLRLNERLSKQSRE